MPRNNAPRIGFISHSPWIAGAERALVNLLQHLPPGRVQALVIFPNIDGPLKSEVEDNLCLPVFELPYTISIPAIGHPPLLESKKQEILAFATLFKELELDAVVVNTTVIYPASIAAALLNLPLILHAHGVLSEVLLPSLDTVQWYKIESIQLQLAERVIVPSDWIASHYRALYRLSHSQLSVLPNGTNLPCLDGANARAAAGPPQFSMLCTLEPNKGVETFLEAAFIVLSRRPSGATFVVYGDHGRPAYRDELESLIQRKGLGGSFVLRPKQLEVSSIYKNSLAVIVASHVESFSFVAIEAMSHSRPVIATRCGGPDEIIEDGETGFLIEIGDSQALAGRILRLIEDAPLCEKMGRAARTAAEKRFDIRTIASEYLSTILSAAQEPRSREWANRRRLLASLLLDGSDSGHQAELAIAGGSGQEHRLSRPAAQGAEPTGITAEHASLNTADLCESLELLRRRLHAINMELC
jgi:glycosyltransferase involved in cell wall biosynthesis